jgi:hypothetical protein
LRGQMYRRWSNQGDKMRILSLGARLSNALLFTVRTNSAEDFFIIIKQFSGILEHFI